MKTAALALLFLGVPIVASCGKSGASIGGSSCACPADTTVACTGALSPVKLPAASAVCLQAKRTGEREHILQR